MAYGQGSGGRRDTRKLPNPAVPPGFEARLRRGGSRDSRDVQAGPSYGGAWPGEGQPQGYRVPGQGYGQQPGVVGHAPYGQMPYGHPPYGQAAPWAAPVHRRQRHVVRNLLAVVGGGVVVLIAIAVVAVANSAVHSTQTTGTTGGSARAGGSPQKATIGTAITLSGLDSGEQMSVSVTKVITDASATDSFNAPPAGDRLVAVQFRLSDTGSAAYSDSPSNGAAVVDSAGQSYQSGLETVVGCQAFGGTENIAPGSSGLGCVTFEVPEAAKIVAAQFTLDSGMGPQTGQWDVAG